ncbi:DUF2946 family protein [Herbaspirillum rhizosphaerae]|uniref:DUF2946 family protein n=1 Tax=Herbaspirillum rhizosphaerae TaxID=346179 RepID=UPI00067D7465|nr:DUF2946 family protein [Herbaspirillum rhizosphaerae]
MPTALRSVAAWIAIACLVFGSLLPLASVAAAKTPASAMAICSTGANAAWQGPGSAPAQPAHAHCSLCCSGQPYALYFPGGNVDAFRATSMYLAAQTLQREHFPQISSTDNRARAPPA